MVEEVRLIYVPFRYFISGHVCLVFKMTDGEDMVISPEADTDNFNPWLGFLPFYKLRYRSVTYSNYASSYYYRDRIVQEVRLDLKKNQVNALLKHVHTRIDLLNQRPERYHILLNSCISNTFKHINGIADMKMGFWLLMIPFKPQIINTKIQSRNQSYKI